MARRRSLEAEETRRDWRTPLRYVFTSFVLLLLVLFGLYAYGRVDEFLAAEPRFRLALPAVAGQESPNLRIEGVVHAPRARIVETFATDLGRSVYLVPLAERRCHLLLIDWLRDAVVSRQWPDRLVVRVFERTPVAFVQLPVTSPAASHRIALIDADGVILEPPARARFSLPVLTGIRPDQPLAGRRQRVRQALRLIEEIGPMAKDVSEMDVADPENLKLVRPLGGRVIVLFLGNRNFLSRLESFLLHYEEIQKRSPEASTFDLRLDDRITAVEEGGRLG